MKKKAFFATGLAVVLALGLQPSSSWALGGNTTSFVLPQYSQKVSLDFKNADLKDVLKAFSKQVGVNFLTEEDVNVKGITVLLSDIPVEEAMERIFSAYGLLYEYDVSNNLMVVKKKAKDAPDVMETRVYQLKFASVPGSDVEKALGGTGVVTTGLTTAGKGSTGKSSGGIVAAIKAVTKGKGSAVIEDPRTNSLIVTDTAANFPNIERLLARLDVPVAVVMIEVEMLDVSKEASDQMGFDWSTGLSFSGGKRSINFPYNAAGSLPSRGVMSLTDVGAVLTFLRSQDDTRALARPRIMTLDNQTASIRISTNEAIGESTTNSSTPTSTSSTSSTNSAERYTTGVLMTVTPQVSLLTDEITLIVEPKVIDATKTVTFAKSGNTYKNPEERGVKSILKVKNGETIIMGGLLRNEEVTTSSKVPFFGDVPLVGNFFKSRNQKKSSRELVVFITPRIMTSDDQFPGEEKMAAEGVFQGEQSISDGRARMIREEMDGVLDR